VVVAPDGRRLVVSAGTPDYPGREEVRLGVLPRHLHGRQFRRLDRVTALTLTPANAPELLEVAQQFRVMAWYLPREGRLPEAAVALLNLLGDRQAQVREVGREPVRETWGAMEWRLLPLSGGAALEASGFGVRVLFLPPLPAGNPAALAPPPGGWDTLVAYGPPSPEWLARARPRRLVLYGEGEARIPGTSSLPEIWHTRKGAVTLRVTSRGVQISQ